MTSSLQCTSAFWPCLLYSCVNFPAIWNSMYVLTLPNLKCAVMSHPFLKVHKIYSSVWFIIVYTLTHLAICHLSHHVKPLNKTLNWYILYGFAITQVRYCQSLIRSCSDFIRTWLCWLRHVDRPLPNCGLFFNDLHLTVLMTNLICAGLNSSYFAWRNLLMLRFLNILSFYSCKISIWIWIPLETNFCKLISNPE